MTSHKWQVFAYYQQYNWVFKFWSTGFPIRIISLQLCNIKFLWQICFCTHTFIPKGSLLWLSCMGYRFLLFSLRIHFQSSFFLIPQLSTHKLKVIELPTHKLSHKIHTHSLKRMAYVIVVLRKIQILKFWGYNSSHFGYSTWKIRVRLE